MTTLDVRPILADGGEPFDLIMQTVAGLAPDEPLELLAPFEPAPLYGVLAAQGFSHATEPLDGGDFRVVFRR